MSSLNLSPTEENCFSYISFLKAHLWTCEMGFLFCTLTWKMAYMMQVSGRWWECSETLKMFRPHLLMSSRSYKMQERIYVQLSYKLDKSARFLRATGGLQCMTVPLRASPPNLFSRRSGPYCSCWTDPGRVGPYSHRWSESSAAAASSFCLAISEWAMGSPVHSVYLQGERFQPVIVHFSTQTLSSQQIPWLYTLSEWIQVSKMKFDISKSHLQELFGQVQQFMLQLNIPWCKESLD